MSQSRAGSIVETIFGTAVGYAVAVVSQILIFPLFGMSLTLSQDAGMAAIFTVISLVRGYLVRRLFNWLHVRRTARYIHDEIGRRMEMRFWRGDEPIKFVDLQPYPHLAEFIDFEREMRGRVATATGIPRQCLRDDTQ